MQLTEVYSETQASIAELAQSLTAEQLGQTLPTCPDWSVRDVLGHMTGLLADAVGENLGGIGTAAWTQAQVDAYAEHPLPDLLKAWVALIPESDAAMPASLAPIANRLVADAWSHEQDIRGAVGCAGNRDAAGLAITLDVQLAMLADRLADAGLAGLRIRTEDGFDRVVGSQPAAATLALPSRWELARGVMSRRSPAQVARYAWDGERIEQYRQAFFRWEPPAVDLVE